MNTHQLIRIFIILILIFSIFQILPEDIKITQEVSAVTTWSETNWSVICSYISYKGLEFINGTGDIKLHYGPRIYVADSDNHRIVKTMMNGCIWDTYGTYGSGINKFEFPSGIYFDNGSKYIFVADDSNNRIVKTKMGGSGWTSFGTHGNGLMLMVSTHSATHLRAFTRGLGCTPDPW